MRNVVKLNGVFVKPYTENELTGLFEPIKPVVLIDRYRLKVECLLKKEVVRVVSGQRFAYDKEIDKILADFFHDAYSLGLKHMDEMHGRADEKAS